MRFSFRLRAAFKGGSSCRSRLPLGKVKLGVGTFLPLPPVEDGKCADGSTVLGTREIDDDSLRRLYLEIPPRSITGKVQPIEYRPIMPQRCLRGRTKCIDHRSRSQTIASFPW